MFFEHSEQRHAILRRVKILILSASMNDPSNSDFLSDRAAEGIKQIDPNAEITKIRLKDIPLEQFSLKFYDTATPVEPAFADLEKKMKEANGVIIATPVWNFSVPGHLKNLIDRIGAFGLDAQTRTRGTLGGKPFFLIFTGGSPGPAWPALQAMTTSHMPVSIKYFGGTMFDTYYEGKSTAGAGVFKLVVDQRPDSIAAVKKKAEAFAKVVQTFADTGSLPLSMKAKEKMYSIGQRIVKKLT